MDIGINVGHTDASATVTAITDGVVRILEASYDFRDREVTIAALGAFQRAASIQNTSISGCSVIDRGRNED